MYNDNDEVNKWNMNKLMDSNTKALTGILNLPCWVQTPDADPSKEIYDHFERYTPELIGQCEWRTLPIDQCEQVEVEDCAHFLHANLWLKSFWV